MRARFAQTLLGMLLAALLAGQAGATDLDPFRTSSQVSPSRANALSDFTPDTCNPSARPQGNVTLATAIEYALCNNPRTQKSWANARAQAAQIGIAKSSFLPTFGATATAMREKQATRVDEHPEFDSDVNSGLRTSRVDMSVVLFDFGARSDNLENARQLLTAANATHDATLQNVLVSTAQNYYDAVTALSNARAIATARNLAGQTFLSTLARFKIGLGTMVEKLQAETAYAQQTVKAVKAQGDVQLALGNLASAMGLPANTPLQIDTDDGQTPDTEFVKSVDTLMEQAKQAHPTLIAARAQVAAAHATEQSVRAGGYPTLSLTGNRSDSTQPSAQLGLPPLTTRSKGTQIGLQLSIPIFDGFGRTYRVRQAAAQTLSMAADLADLELGVSLGVWRAYQSLLTATGELKVSEQFRTSAAKTADAAEGRFKSGATDVLEMLNAQSVLATAEQQRVQAMSDWRTARLKLAFSLGILGSWAMR